MTFTQPTTAETESKTLTDLIRSEIRQSLLETRCAIPGKIVSFDGTRAKVQPLFKTILAPETTAISLPEIVDVPVCFPVSSGGNSYITIPVKAGDTGTITFYDRDMARWLYGDGSAVEPENVRIHDLTDASFTPDLTPFDNAIGADTTDMKIVNDGLEMTIDPTGKISVSNGEELIDLLVQTLDALQTATVATSMGPQQLSTVLDGTILTLKTKLETFKI